MKMRKRIAALIAVAMIAALVPMTAFAASTNRVTQIVKVTDDGDTTDPKLNIEFKDGLAAGKTFYLKLDNAEWQAESEIAITTSTTTGSVVDLVLKRDSDTEVSIKAGPNGVDVGASTSITLATTKIKGEATVEVVAWDTTVTEGKYVFATSSDKKTKATVGDAPAFYTGTNNIAKITLEESALGALSKAKTGETIEIILDNDDFEFTGVVSVKGGRGFSDLTEAEIKTGLDFTGVTNKDKQRFVITKANNATFAGKQRGTIEIELEVKSATKRPEIGDLMADISGDFVETKELKVAKIAEYGVELKSEKDYEFVAGQVEEVEFHLNEIVDDSMVGGRVTEFTLPEGVYFADGQGNGILVDGDLEKDKQDNTINIEYSRDGDDNKINGFSARLAVDPEKIDKFKFKAKLDITSSFEGDIVLKAEGRSIGEDLEVKLAKVEAPVKVTVEPMKVKPGFKEQVGGKIIIEETDKARLMQGKKIVLSLDGEAGMSLLDDPKVEITKGDLRKGDVDVNATKEGTIEITVKRRSKEASTIEISDIRVKLNRNVPQGFYDIEVGGTAISELAEKRYETYQEDNVTKYRTYGIDPILGKKFIIVGDPITGVKSEVAFTIGSEKFLVDGVAHTMDAAPYIKDGRTMVPLRYLATALGIDTESIKFNAGIVTIFVGNGNVVQVQVGSKELRTNGMVIPMVAAAEIIDGRTYVPVTEIGGVFGVTGTWDAATQTATFK